MQALSSSRVDEATRAIAGELGDDAVVADRDLLERYGEDASGAGLYMPDLVVRAGSTEHVRKVLAIATRLGVPVTPRGLGSGKAGGALPIFGGIVLSLERMTGIREISRDDMLVVAGPGTITKDLMRAVESEGLFYPPDPNSLHMCSIGGNVACNAGGPRALKYGVTKNYVLELEVVLPTGDVMRVGKRTIKHVTGYDLAALIVGSEGTLGVITEVTLRLIPQPGAVETALVSFADLSKASRAITGVLSAGIVPRTLELLDQQALSAVRTKTPGRFPENAGALVILETDGSTKERAFEDLERAGSVCMDFGALDIQVAQDEAQRERIWEPRRVLSMTLSETAPKKISEDIVVPRSQIPEILERTHRIAERHAVRAATYGHAGDGNLHVNILFDHASEPRAHAAVDEIMRATIALGGTISGEHGVGLTKRDFLAYEHEAPKIAVQRALKKALDPAGILNPGKIFPLGGVTE
jgi:glycolate oxidase